jgi:hypothetical protein
LLDSRRSCEADAQEVISSAPGQSRINARQFRRCAAIVRVLYLDGRSLWVPSGTDRPIPRFQVWEDPRTSNKTRHAFTHRKSHAGLGVFCQKGSLGLGMMKPKTCPICKRPIPMSKTERADAGAAARQHRRSEDDAQPPNIRLVSIRYFRLRSIRVKDWTRAASLRQPSHTSHAGPMRADRGYALFSRFRVPLSRTNLLPRTEALLRVV